LVYTPREPAIFQLKNQFSLVHPISTQGTYGFSIKKSIFFDTAPISTQETSHFSIKIQFSLVYTPREPTVFQLKNSIFFG